MTVSLMPPDLDQALSRAKLRELMTYLRTEPAAPDNRTKRLP